MIIVNRRAIIVPVSDMKWVSGLDKTCHPHPPPWLTGNIPGGVRLGSWLTMFYNVNASHLLSSPLTAQQQTQHNHDLPFIKQSQYSKNW